MRSITVIALLNPEIFEVSRRCLFLSMSRLLRLYRRIKHCFCARYSLSFVLACLPHDPLPLASLLVPAGSLRQRLFHKEELHLCHQLSVWEVAPRQFRALFPIFTNHFPSALERRLYAMTPTENPHEALLTVREVARQLRVNDVTVKRWIKNGVLEAILLPRIGKRQSYRIRKSTLDALLADAASQQRYLLDS